MAGPPTWCNCICVFCIFCVCVFRICVSYLNWRLFALKDRRPGLSVSHSGYLGCRSWPVAITISDQRSTLFSFFGEIQTMFSASRPQMVKRHWVKPGAVVIDCGKFKAWHQALLQSYHWPMPFKIDYWDLKLFLGINSIPDSTKKTGQRLVGDVDYDDVSIVQITQNWLPILWGVSNSFTLQVGSSRLPIFSYIWWWWWWCYCLV